MQQLYSRLNMKALITISTQLEEHREQRKGGGNLLICTGIFRMKPATTAGGQRRCIGSLYDLRLERGALLRCVAVRLAV